MANGLTKRRFDSLNALFNIFVAPPSAPPSALQLCAPAPSELTPQVKSEPISAPVPAPSYPPSPSVEVIQELEQKRIDLQASARCQADEEEAWRFKKNCQEATYHPLGSVPDGWPTKKLVGAIYVFYRDGDLDA